MYWLFELFTNVFDRGAILVIHLFSSQTDQLSVCCRPRITPGARSRILAERFGEIVFRQPVIGISFSQGKLISRTRGGIFICAIEQGPLQIRRRGDNNISNVLVATIQLGKTYDMSCTYCHIGTSS
jgi:hypothetical protein